MQIEFEDRDLLRLYEDAEFRIPKFGPKLTQKIRKVVGIIDAASDERDLRALKSLHFEKLVGARRGQYSLRLLDQARLVFRFGDNGKLIVIEVTDYH